MKKLTLLIASFITLSAFAQKIDYDKKTGAVTDESGATLFIMEGIKSTLDPLGLMKDYSVKTNDGKEIIFVKVDYYDDRSKIDQSNPNGRTFYWILNFLDSKQTAEIAIGPSPKTIAKNIYNAKLITADGLDEKAVERFVFVTGNHFSERRNQLGGNTIIINNVPR